MANRPIAEIEVDDFSQGCGAMDYSPGAYQLALDWDGLRKAPGPREVADMTGIAAGYRVYQMLKHADVLFAITSNGTDTKVYRKETGAWALKATISSRVPSGAQAAVSFKNILAIGFTGGNPYQYSSDTGGGAYTFTASTKTADNSEQATCFLVQANGIPIPRVTYCLNPNEVYYTQDLTNTDGAGVAASRIGDNASTQNYFTSIAEEPSTGRVIFGMRHALYTLHYEQGYAGTWERLTDEFPDPVGDAGGQSDRLNFEDPKLVGGVLYYPVGYDLLAWYGSGTPYNRYMAPRWTNDCKIPRMDLPINAMTTAAGGQFLLLFIGSKNTATLKSVVNFPGGNTSLGGQFSVNSDMYIGVPASGKMIWHGVALQVSNPLRYAFYDEDDHYVYMASGDSESADVQMTRCLFPSDNPTNRVTSSAVVLNTGTWKLELGGMDFGSSWSYKRGMYVRAQATGLASSSPSLEVEYKVTPDWDTTTYESSFVTWTSPEDAYVGAELPDPTTLFRKLYIRLVGVGGSDVYTMLQKLVVVTSPAPEMDRMPRHR